MHLVTVSSRFLIKSQLISTNVSLDERIFAVNNFQWNKRMKFFVDKKNFLYSDKFFTTIFLPLIASKHAVKIIPVIKKFI